MTKEQIIQEAERLLPQGYAVVMSWAMALPEEDQPVVAAWADQKRQALQGGSLPADADQVFEQISRGLKA
ncbi:MAG: hypothetical protein H7Y32_12155 [Chloroflexales bacterium]|nr:hypothetical protein [Chloroflexales bacterium]